MSRTLVEAYFKDGNLTGPEWAGKAADMGVQIDDEPTSGAAADEETAEVIELPLAMSPAAVTEVSVSEVPMNPTDVKSMLARMEYGTLGFKMVPFTSKGTATMVRELHRSLLTTWLQLGAYLLRAKLMTENVEDFWKWFDGQDFPFKRRWAYQAISSCQMVLTDPELRKVARRMSSISSFRVVAKQLCSAQGKAEYAQSGTVFGRPADTLDQLTRAELQAASKGPGTPETEAPEDPQLKLLPLQEVTAQRDRMETELIASKQKMAELETKLNTRNEELLQSRHALTVIQNPALNVDELSLTFREELSKAKSSIMVALENLRPLRRRDLQELDAHTIFTFFATILLVNRQSDLILREMESKWGGAYPELLRDAGGAFRDPLPHGALKLIAQETREVWQATNAAFEGRPLAAVDKSTGEIACESTDGPEELND